MYKYTSKLPVNQMNILSNQLKLSYNYLTHDKDLSGLFQQPDYATANIATLETIPTDKTSPFHNKTSSLTSAHVFMNGRYGVLNRGSGRGSSRGSSRTSTRPNIIGKYYKLIERKTSLNTLSGRVQKSSDVQNRGYASFLKKITNFFGGKSKRPVTPVKTKKCGKVKGCPRKSNATQVCVKPPPSKTDYETATKCTPEALKDDMKYMEIICPQKVEVEHKEKPPFASEDGQFLEDRLCKEMPEKRCQKIIEEQSLKQEKLEEIRKSEMVRKNELQVEEKKALCVKSKKKEKLNVKSKTEPCLITESCSSPCQDDKLLIKPDLFVEKEDCKLHKEDVCIPIAEEALLAKSHKCRNVKVRKTKKTSKDQTKSCNEGKKKDPCANVKPCEPSLTELKPCPALQCLPAIKQDDASKKCGMIVRPCGSGHKELERGKHQQTKQSKSKDHSQIKQSVKEKLERDSKPWQSSKTVPSSTQSKSNCSKTVPCKKRIKKMRKCSELMSKTHEERDDQSKKPSRQNANDCSSSCSKRCGNNGMSCQSKSNFSNIMKSYSTQPGILTGHNLVVSSNKQYNLEEIAGEKYTESLDSSTMITIQPKALDAYSKVSMRLDETGIVSVNLDVDKTKPTHLVPQIVDQKRKFLNPIVDITKHLQIRDSKWSRLPYSRLLKLHRLKSSAPYHELGKIPDISPRATFKTFSSSPNLMSKDIFSASNLICAHFSTNTCLWYYTGAPRYGPTDDEQREPIILKRTLSTSDVPSGADKKECPRAFTRCKKEKDTCAVSGEQEKRSCKFSKAEIVADRKKEKRCNFEMGIKAEEKYNKKKQLCPSCPPETDTICPPKKKQLCCYNNKKCKPKEPIPKECPLCEKFKILDLPPKTRSKKIKCNILKCGDLKPCTCLCKSASAESGASCRRRSFDKSNLCPTSKRPAVKQEPPKQTKKVLCAQKKCTKKQPKPPCPIPIKAPRLEDLPKKDACLKDCAKKSKQPLDEAARKTLAKMCAKPSGRVKMTCAKGKSACDRDKVAEDRAAKERAEKEEKDRVGTGMKHTDWRAVPIKGDNHWCKSTPLEKNTKCTGVQSKIVLPSTVEKYQSPRYKKADGTKGSCSSKRCPTARNKNVRKMHSCPLVGDAPRYRIIKASASHNIPRDYFENMASIITGRESYEMEGNERNTTQKNFEEDGIQEK